MVEKRKYPRFETDLPIRFNLNPDHHYVPEIRRMGVGGKIHNISLEGFKIDSHLDLMDVCQIFSEAIEDNSPFRLEIQLWDSRGRSSLLKGLVRWYKLSELKNDVRHFQAGLRLEDADSRATTQSILESITGLALA